MIPEHIDCLKKMDKAFKKQEEKVDTKKFIFSSKKPVEKVVPVEESSNKYVRGLKRIGANIQKQNEKMWGFK